MTEGHQQRRLATILAADVFGYSRLMAEDEEYALRMLKAYRGLMDRLIARHDGRIFSTAGDGILAEFGSAVEAVRCAITIQEELRVRNAQCDEKRRMEWRIGINVGDVLVDGDNLYGDGVNIAARLESIATPGNICISGSVFTLVKNKLSYGFEDIGPQLVKNIPEPVPAFRLMPSTNARHASKVDNRLIAAGGVTVLLLIGFVGWVVWGSQSNPPNPVSLRIQPEKLSRHSQGSAVDARQSEAGKAFDGVWEFQLTGGEYCPIKFMTFLRRISDGFVTSDDGRKLGSIAKDGSFQFSNPSPGSKNIIVESRGAIKGETGQGSYLGVGTPCQGTYQIRLVGKPNG